MLDAILFDWADTLFQFVYDEALFEAGWEAGLAAIGRTDLPSHEASAARFCDHYFPSFFGPDVIEEIEYPAVIREVFRDFGADVTDEEIDRFVDAEHAAWEPARRLAATTHTLLDSLRDRGLRLGLVSNAFDPGWLLRRDLDDMGLTERLDVAVFSSEVGLRKPHPSIFEAALAALEVEPERVLFVGDRRYEDVRGAKQVGMRTVLALWFRADEDDRGLDPDFEAFAQMDVLDVVRGLHAA